MNHNRLFALFTSAINWNAFLYIIYKSLFTLLTFFLYKKLSTNDFSVWANLNSSIFLLLLWLDLGFRKSIPRFAPEFAKNYRASQQFIKNLIILQILILLCFTPLLLLITSLTLHALKILHHTPILVLASCMFFLGGITAILQLIYHSHFFNKEFNVLKTIVTTGQITINMILIYKAKTSTELLIGILIVQVMSNMIIIFISLIHLNQLYLTTAHQQENININELRNAFIKHSAAMWANNNLKSLSERNFLVPFLTYTIGPAGANMFKVANDSALVFHRIVIKTIGSADTALFAHIEVLGKKNNLTAIAFKKISSKIAGLCIPFLGLFIILAITNNQIFKNDSFVFQSFLIMGFGYLIETMFLPYERILEVKKKYLYLIIGYLPYIIMLIFLITGNIIPYIGLVKSIALIHCVRLVSILIIMYFARAEYHVIFPIGATFRIGLTSFIVGLSLYTLTPSWIFNALVIRLLDVRW